jgi:hypothetical protein
MNIEEEFRKWFLEYFTFPYNGKANYNGEKAAYIAGAKMVQEEEFGCALAVRVMQSDLYERLDDLERAECDELVRRWTNILKAQAIRQLHSDEGP